MRPVLHHAIALLAVLVSAVLPAWATDDPKAFVTAIYQNFIGANGILINSPKARQVITPGLMKLIDADAKAAARRGQPPRLDSNPFIDAQDSDIKSFTVEVQDVGTGPGRRHGQVQKRGGGQRRADHPRAGDDRRRLADDDFRGDSGSLRKYLSRKPKR
jgi:hypothetical protein